MTSNTTSGISSLIPTIYKDLAQPSVQKIGKALSSLTGVFTSSIAAASEIAEKNLVRLAQRLDEEKLEEIRPTPPEIAVPILQRLQYTRGEELADLYTELFVKASLERTQDSTHPGYVEIMANLSVDEAKIIGYIASRTLHNARGRDIPYIEIREERKDEKGYLSLQKYTTGLRDHIDFVIPSNEIMYLENLQRLGIISDNESKRLADEQLYEPLLSRPEVNIMKKLIEDRGHTMDTNKSFFRVTDFGERFIETCVRVTKKN